MRGAAPLLRAKKKTAPAFDRGLSKVLFNDGVLTRDRSLSSARGQMATGPFWVFAHPCRRVSAGLGIRGHYLRGHLARLIVGECRTLHAARKRTDTLICLGEVAASTAGRGFDHILKECLEEVGNFRVIRSVDCFLNSFLVELTHRISPI